MGVAASKGASACWTSDILYTWGTNNGQLGMSLSCCPGYTLTRVVGYDKAAQPVQILPRKVTKVTGGVVSVSLTVCCT